MFIAMFQIPNKFFDVGRQVVDAGGKEWDPAWAHFYRPELERRRVGYRRAPAR